MSALAVGAHVEVLREPARTLQLTTKTVHACTQVCACVWMCAGPCACTDAPMYMWIRVSMDVLEERAWERRRCEHRSSR